MTATVSRLGIGALAVGAALIALLGFLPSDRPVSALRQTISQYGLTDNRWIFNVAVILVALGSAGIFGILHAQKRLPASSAVLGALWTVGLLVIVAFPKTNWAIEATTSATGTLHRIASVVAFVSLPVAVLLAAARAFPHAPHRRTLARLLGWASLGWFAAILAAVPVGVAVGGNWWELIPLGLMERGLAFTEVVALAAIAVPAVKSLPDETDRLLAPTQPT
ncbi:DUF998 domain-containing protein [Kutzneria buriramensis]|uniref:Uncharacterized protein DUF998 n=1 Tax=Kutzneria buriramensis TaxID=1045776 RepID=A0A3E0HYN1_9PSEU|nr:DUF998 domain-containing protein [Kutzneria buriramensis]REH51559.1 uncharacterized protein DUF998 [Kutzneria buriramensis]